MLDALQTALADVEYGRAGVRLYGRSAVAALLATDTPVGLLAAARLGAAARPVRAVLFNKTPGVNWALGWHQDRTVAVRARHDLPGWGPMVAQDGRPACRAAFAVIEGMVTLRIHLDPVPADNAPLLIAPGSHRLGRLGKADLATAVAQCGTALCLAERGDLWCMRHRSCTPRRRRPATRIVASCRSTMRPRRCRRRWRGWGCDRSVCRSLLRSRRSRVDCDRGRLPPLP